MNEVRAACVAELHSLAYDQFKTTQDYKEYCLSKKDLGEPVEEGERVLIYTPKDPAALKERLAKMPKCSTKLKALDAIKNGSGKRVYEAWTSFKHSSEKTERVMIGRDHKCDVAVDDDKRVSREHARIDSLKDGRVVFLDLGSSHGSKVNGKTVSGRVFLNAGRRRPRRQDGHGLHGHSFRYGEPAPLGRVPAAALLCRSPVPPYE